AGELVGALAPDQDGAIGGRTLADRPGEVMKRGKDVLARRTVIGGGFDLAFDIVRIAGLAPADGKAIFLHVIDDVADGFRCLAKCDGKNARCKRIQRSGMPNLFRVGDALDARNDMGGGHSGSLVNIQPAVNRRSASLSRHTLLNLAVRSASLADQRVDMHAIVEGLVASEGETRREFHGELTSELRLNDAARPRSE